MATPTTLTERLAPAIRLPGPYVPGWFPLVAERAHHLMGAKGGVRTVDLLGSTMRLDLGEYMQRRFYYHCYEAPEVRFFERWLRPGDAVADVGAHVGFFTLLAARLVGPAGEVHAFEPVPVNYERLVENVGLNGLENVRLERSAVGDQEGEVSLGLAEERLVGESTCDYTVGGELGGVTAPVTTLDAYLERRSTPRLRLVKIDVEGFEPKVLAGLAGTFDDAPPEAIVFEHNATMLLSHDMRPTAVFEDLAARGYRMHRLGQRGGLRPAPPLERLEEAVRRSTAAGHHKSRLRAGIATRDTLLNVVAIHETAAAG